MQEEERQTTVPNAEPAVAPETAPATSTHTVARTGVSGNTIAKRVVYYVAGIIIALIALRFIFLLLGANRDSGFVDFIYGLSGVFVAPFNGIFGEPTFGVSYFETSSIVAIIIYALVALGIGKLLTINRTVN